MPCTTPAEITFALPGTNTRAYVYTEGASEFVRTIMHYTRISDMRVLAVS